MRHPLDRTSPMPLWAQLADDLRRRCRAGELDGLLPGEHHLAEEYDVSRHTVREALRHLRAEGLLVAARGRGTTVVEPGAAAPPGALYSLFRSIESSGVAQRSAVRRLGIVRDAAVAARLGRPAGTDLVVLERRRLAGGSPVAVDTSWLPADLARPLLVVDFTRTALYDELTARCDVTLDAGRERITAVVPPADLAGDLDVGPGVPVLFLQRLASARGAAVEWRETYLRADRYHVVAEWSATSALSVDVVGAADPDPRW